ncbi:uncharacterized protein FYW49_005325 [Xenentodon cancila]
MSAAEQKQMGVMVFENCFVILNASVNHQGNYSCDSRRNTSSRMWFMVTVYTAPSKEYEERNQYPITCHKQQSCTLDCPHDLAEDTPNITSRGITWKKDGEKSPSYFPSVEEKQGGVYTCTRSYLYAGQMYNMTFTVPLTVTEGMEECKTVVIDCEAITKSCIPDTLFWMSNNTFVDEDEQCRVFYNESW